MNIDIRRQVANVAPAGTVTVNAVLLADCTTAFTAPK